MDKKYLQLIGKGQITIPQVWRAVLHLDTKIIKASLQGNKIVLEPVEDENEKDWDITSIQLNSLSKIDKKLIKQGRSAYKKGDKNKFLTATEFFKSENV